MSSPRFGLGRVFVWGALLGLFACSSELSPDALEGRPCPCVSGYVCDVATSTCVRPMDDAGPSDSDAASTDASTDAGLEAGLSDAGAPDAASPDGAVPDAASPDGAVPDAGTAFEQCARRATPEPVATCPAECSSCEAGTCIIRCDQPGQCADKVSCPPGLACQVSCAADDTCKSAQVSCPEDFRCEVRCEGRRACVGVVTECTSGACELYCGSAAQVCRDSELRCGSGGCLAYCSNVALVPNLVDCDKSCNRDCACAGL